VQSSYSGSLSRKSSSIVLKNEQQREQQAQNKNKALMMLILLMIPKLLKALASQTKEAALRIAQGQEPIPLDYPKRWGAQLTEAQREEAVKALHVGWTIGGANVPDAKAPSMPEEARIPVTGTGDQFSQNLDFAPPLLARILAFLAMASKLSADTHAKRIQREYDKLKQDKELDNKAISEKVLERMEKKDKNHADLIAQTNITWTGNEGLLQRYKAEGVLAMSWWTLEDERVCPSCFSLHGKVVSVDTPFVAPNSPLTVELPDGSTQTVTAPSWGVMHPPLHSRCRCHLTPVFVNVV